MLKVAVVHEWLVDYSGSERVLEQLLKMFPNADLFAVVDFLPGLMIMVGDQRRISQQDGQWTYSDLHKAVSIYGLTIGGL